MADIMGTPGPDELVGTDGDDTIQSFAGDDTVYGGLGDDSIDSDGDNDSLFGGDGRDFLQAGDGDDWLDGGPGNDTLEGGNGFDTYVLSPGGGADAAIDADGSGRVLVEGDLTAGDLHLERQGDDLVIVLDGTGDRMALRDWFISGARIESIEISNTEEFLNAADLVAANTAPTLEAPLADQGAQAGSSFSFAVPTGAFTDADSGDSIAFSATLADGSALPSWLAFDAATGQFSGTAPADAGTFEIKVTATDLLGAQASDVFAFSIAEADAQGEHIIGTNRNDRLVGTDGDDIIDGRKGADKMIGGKGDDTYYVDTAPGHHGHHHHHHDHKHHHHRHHHHRGDQVVEGKNEGHDTVYSSVSFVLPANVEDLHLLGSKSIDGTGNSMANWIEGNKGNNDLRGGAGDDLLQGGKGNDDLRGGKGVDVLQGGDGNDDLKDRHGATVFDGGAGNDEMEGGRASDFFAGGRGNDELELGGGNDVIAFNKGDGRDKIEGECQDGVLSLGGGIRYEDLRFRKDGKDLVLETGGSDRLVFEDWYKGKRSIATLQVVAESMAGFGQDSGNPLLDDKVELFDFRQLVAAFDDAQQAKKNQSGWKLMNELLDAHLGGSDDLAFGGDLAYRYGMTGTLEGMSWDAARDTVAASGFGMQKQTLQPLAHVQDDSVKLVG
jgi:Ca2+-binding RTX toxin-like protein